MGLPGFGSWIVTLGIILFTFSTIIGWSYYGDRSVGYLFGLRGVHVYRWIYILLIPIGAAMKVEPDVDHRGHHQRHDGLSQPRGA